MERNSIKYIYFVTPNKFKYAMGLRSTVNSGDTSMAWTGSEVQWNSSHSHTHTHEQIAVTYRRTTTTKINNTNVFIHTCTPTIVPSESRSFLHHCRTRSMVGRLAVSRRQLCASGPVTRASTCVCAVFAVCRRHRDECLIVCARSPVFAFRLDERRPRSGKHSPCRMRACASSPSSSSK